MVVTLGAAAASGVDNYTWMVFDAVGDRYLIATGSTGTIIALDAAAVAAGALNATVLSTTNTASVPNKAAQGICKRFGLIFDGKAAAYYPDYYGDVWVQKLSN